MDKRFFLANIALAAGVSLPSWSDKPKNYKAENEAHAEAMTKAEQKRKRRGEKALKNAAKGGA